MRTRAKAARATAASTRCSLAGRGERRLVGSRGPALGVALAAALGIGAMSVGAGCGSRPGKNGLGTLQPPRNAAEWESRYGVAFDDGYTPTALNLEGRAPNDVTDQRLFEARLGYADLVLLATVEQVWGRGRYEGRQDQYVELLVDRELLGQLDDRVRDTQLVQVRASDDLPPELRGQQVLLFLRWAPGDEPPFHHHLMPADDAIVQLIDAKVAHAQSEGVLDKNRAPAGRGGSKKGDRRRGRKENARARARREEGAD